MAGADLRLATPLGHCRVFPGVTGRASACAFTLKTSADAERDTWRPNVAALPAVSGRLQGEGGHDPATRRQSA